MTRNYRTTYDARPALEGAAIATGLLVAEHLGLYRFRGWLPLPVRYALGVLALGLGLVHACAEREDLTAARDAVLIVLCGGALVAGAHAARWTHFRMREGHPDAVSRVTLARGA